MYGFIAWHLYKMGGGGGGGRIRINMTYYTMGKFGLNWPFMGNGCLYATFQ